MTITITPIPSTIELAAPAFTLGTTNTAGAATTAVSSNSTLLAFDATVPTTIAYSASAAVGSAVVPSRRDHSHGMAAATAAATLAKVWGKCTAAGALASPSYNITSSGKDSTGVYTWTWADDFTDVDYALLVTPYDATAFFNPDTVSVGSVKVRMFDTGSSAADRGHSVLGFGEN